MSSNLKTPPLYRPSSIQFLGLILLVLDGIGLFLFYKIACLILNFKPSATFSSIQFWPYFFLLIFFYVFELYKVSLQISGLRSPQRTFVAVLMACVLIVFFNTLNFFTEAVPLKVIALNFGFFSLWASVSRFIVAKLSENHFEKIRWLVLDPENIFDKIYPQFVKKHNKQKFYVKSSHQPPSHEDAIQYLDNTQTLKALALEPWSGVIVTHPKLLSEEERLILTNLRMQDVLVYNLPQFYEAYLHKIPVTHLEKDWFTVSQGFDLLHNPIGLKLKRITDLILSIVGLVLGFPFMILIALVIKLTSKGPVIFSQIRNGENNCEFTLYKFRSMKIDAEINGAQWAQKLDPRVTPFGKFLRASRLDELPQLWNVIRGDMSFIGPRPERPIFNKDLEKKIPFYQLRHLVKPGITGWAQVLYPYGASVEDAKEKLEFDIYYIKNYSLFLDLSIVFKTLRVILWGKGR